MRPLLCLVTLVGLPTLVNPALAQTLGTTPGTPQALSAGNRALGNINSGMVGLGNARSGTNGTSNPPGGQAGQSDPTASGEWFIHRDRRPGSFVGSSSKDQVGFVGEKDATTGGSVQTAVTAKVRVTSLIDILRARSATDLYDPHLEVGFATKPRSPEALSSALARQLNSSPSLHLSSPISVSVAGQTATMRGEVADEWDRAMAEQMLLFEPGISEVQNQLTVKPRSPLRLRSDRK